MKKIFAVVALVGLMAILQACATARVDVSRDAPAVKPKFERVAVPPFGNEVGAELPATAPENVAGEIIAMLQKDHPGLFREVKSTPAKAASELIVQGKILNYNPGSKAARFILIGLGSGKLELEITLVNGGTGETLEQFSTSGSLVAGGISGATMGIEDMIKSAAKKVVERLVPYGSGQ